MIFVTRIRLKNYVFAYIIPLLVNQCIQADYQKHNFAYSLLVIYES